MFEFFFKYPRSVYERGQFALLGAWPKWALVLLILMAAAALAWLIRSRLAEAAPVMRSWRAWVVWGMQSCSRRSCCCCCGSRHHCRATQAATEHHRRAGGRLAQHGHNREWFHAPGAGRERVSERRPRELNRSFQTRLYRVDAAPARIANLNDL